MDGNGAQVESTTDALRGVAMSFPASITFVEIFLLCLPGVQGGHSVTYSHPRVCALKGDSVILHCKFYLDGVGHYIEGEWYKENEGRFREYNHPNHPDCSLKIDKLSVGHSGVYHFQFKAFLWMSWMTSRSRVTLSVTDLQVKEDAVVGNQNQTKVTCSTSCSLASQYVWYKNGQTLQGKTTASILLDSTRPSEAAYYSCAVKSYAQSSRVCVPEKHCWVVKCSSNSGGERVLQVTVTPETVTEGGEVTLTCSTCAQSNNPALIWYKNKQPVSNKHTTRDNKLLLNPVSSEDAGNYSCAVKGDESLSSTAVFLNVSCAPKNVSVSVSPGETEEGSLVTLTCSSDANPPVHTYTWYMKSGAEALMRGTGESISFSVTSDTSGLYYCEAQNEVGSQNSAEVAVGIEGSEAVAVKLVASITTFIILASLLTLAIVLLRRTGHFHGCVVGNHRSPDCGSHADVYQNDKNMPLQSTVQDSVYENLQRETPPTEMKLKDFSKK